MGPEHRLTWRQASERPVLVDTVEKVENRTAPKISRNFILSRLYRCNALYRCITLHEPQSIRDAVHNDLKLSQSIYNHVDTIAQRLGADPRDQVPFEKYAKAAESLLKP